MPLTSFDKRPRCQSEPGVDEAAHAVLEHGGRLREAAAHYGIDLSQWLDLSTGINPRGWPVPAVPQLVWSRLPEESDGLEDAARRYYRAAGVLPVAGSQVAIQLLPRLFSARRVRVISPGYAEHAAAWQNAGHSVRAVSAEAVEAALPTTDVLVLINPNNPTGVHWSAEQMLEWHARLAARGGHLVVDEAFADSTPELSLAAHANRRGLIVLRSLGKFFGLAGMRVGFVCAEQQILAGLRKRLGPWHVSTPARWVAKTALQDSSWQAENRQSLLRDSGRLRDLLAEHGLTPNGGCALFQWTRTSRAAAIHEALARQGILIRLFRDESGLRFGLPGPEEEWQRLALALEKMSAA